MTGRKRAAVAAVAGLVASGLLVVSAAASTTGRADSATIYAATTHQAGGYTYAAGQGNDAVLGSVAITYKIKLQPTTVGTFNLTARRVVEYTRTGSMRGTATATVTVAADGTETITNGKVALKHGVGSLTGHSFKGTFSGTGSATANELILHVTGTYR